LRPGRIKTKTKKLLFAIFFFSAKQAASRSKSKEWLPQNQENDVSE